MTSNTPVRIGTRGSPLALAQTRAVRDQLIASDPNLAKPGAIEIVVIKTTGDAIQDRPLSDIGGKGLFTREIDQAMGAGRIDIAVHSVKDVPTWLPDEILLACVPSRADPRDAFISPRANKLLELPGGSVVGTASLRRQAQILGRRPDLRVEVLRGNVETRLKKLADGIVDATLLAVAGLSRLGKEEHITSILPTAEMLPAVGQGALGITCRRDDETARRRLQIIEDREAADCITAERGFLEILDGSCRTPIAALATIGESGLLSMRGLVASPDGAIIHEVTRDGSRDDAEELGHDAGKSLIAKAGQTTIDSWK
ncbi:MAG: hydroxymethylbilane synthase [Rhodospirillales bacterium]|nr:hydroxymethylbilane synthase [Rhodospirillales bacterium]